MTQQAYAKMSSDAVRKATGKTWEEWFALLDADDAKKMTHQEIVALLRSQHGVGMWWQQMLTVGYEQARGKRVVNERTDGFTISRSKTVAVPLAELFAAWKDIHQRRKWLADPDFTIRKATANKSMRITWIDGATNVALMFAAKRDGKSQVTLNHSRLKNAQAAAKRKVYWGEQLEKLKTLLEK